MEVYKNLKVRKDQKKFNWEEEVILCCYAPTAKHSLYILNVCPTDLMVLQILSQLQDLLQSRSNIIPPFAEKVLLLHAEVKP